MLKLDQDQGYTLEEIPEGFDLVKPPDSSQYYLPSIWPSQTWFKIYPNTSYAILNILNLAEYDKTYWT